VLKGVEGLDLSDLVFNGFSGNLFGGLLTIRLFLFVAAFLWLVGA
jgi:hypothetical protein